MHHLLSEGPRDHPATPQPRCIKMTAAAGLLAYLGLRPMSKLQMVHREQCQLHYAAINSSWGVSGPGTQHMRHIPEAVDRQLFGRDAELVAQLPNGCAAGARHSAAGHVGVGVELPQRPIRERVAAAGVGPHPRECDLRRGSLLQQQPACESKVAA